MKSNRIWEVDFLRGTAILLMVVFHLVVDLKDFYSSSVEYLTGFWFYVGKLSAILFIFTAGISATLSTATPKHGLKIFLWGMILTLVTYFYNDQTYIRFGILHFLGVSIFSYRLIAEFAWTWLNFAGLFLFVIGYMFTPLITDSPYLFPLGFVKANFQSIDYYPLIPWYGIFLIGAATGKKHYRNKASRFSDIYCKPIVLLGRNSLIIYLIHQPILLALLYLFF